MVKIEVNNVTVKVPQSWEDVLLGDYETFYRDRPQTARQRAEYVAKIVKMDAALLMSWPAEVFNFMVDTMGFLFSDNPVEPSPFIEAGGVKYTISLEEKQPLGAWVDAEEAQKSEDKVLSGVLGIVCRPAGEVYDYVAAEQRQKLFASLPMSKVLGALAFFLQCRNVLERRTQAFTRLQEALDLLPRSIRLSPRRGGGIRLLRIWPVMKYFALTLLLRYRLRKLLRSFSTDGTRL